MAAIVLTHEAILPNRGASPSPRSNSHTCVPVSRWSGHVAAAVAAVEADLGDAGRVLLRPSGTEQLVRVMVEAATQRDAEAIAGHLAEVVSAI
jgi:phosphomannomutase